jgi:hypothetical protein
MSGAFGFEAFAEVDAAIDDFEAECAMGVLRHVGVDPGVGRDLATTLLDAPRLGGRYQRLSDTAPPAITVDEPPFHETTRLRRVAPVGVGSQAYLDEANQLVIGVGDEHDEGQRGARSPREEGLGVRAMLIGGSIRPKETSHLDQGRSITELGAADSHESVLSRWGPGMAESTSSHLGRGRAGRPKKMGGPSRSFPDRAYVRQAPENARDIKSQQKNE